MTSVSLNTIVKRYASGVEAVHGVTLQIEPGEFLVMVGPSGCGKSTLLRMIAGLEDITSGELYFDGKLMNNVAPKDRDVGMVFQNYALYPHLTVEENIAFPLVVRRTESKSAIYHRVREVARMLGLDELLHRKPKELSGGQRQRVALGRAVARKPRVFLFDEPLSNLDAKLRVQMRQEINHLQRSVGSTSIYVTHDQTEAMTMGDRIAVMRGGALQQAGAPKEIYDNPSNQFVAGFIGSPAMNFISGVIEHESGGVYFREHCGFVCAMEDLRYSFKTLPHSGTQVTLGFRPEHISPASGHGIAVFGTIQSVEFLGHETLLYFQTAQHGSMLCSRITSEQHFTPGATAHFSVQPDKVYFFDKDGNRL